MSAIPMICLPFAGAGATFFKTWTAPAGTLELVPLQLPGREERFIDEPHRTVAAAVTELAATVRERFGAGGKVAIFGHSMGAVLAYELARRLVETMQFEIALLVVSGSPAPDAGRAQRATELSDDAFVARVAEFAGYSHPVLQDPEMRELLLPTLRADVELHENYVPTAQAPLAVPILAVRGKDDELVSRHDMEQWQRAGTAGFQVAELDGGHMYIVDHSAALLGLIEQALQGQAVEASDAVA